MKLVLILNLFVTVKTVVGTFELPPRPPEPPPSPFPAQPPIPLLPIQFHFMKKVVALVVKMHGLDPLSVPDASNEVKEDAYFMNFTGTVINRQNIVHGLRTFQVDDTLLKWEEDKMAMSATIRAGPVGFKSRMEVKINPWLPRTNLTIDMVVRRLETKITLAFSNDFSQLSLWKLEMTKFRVKSIWIRGMFILGPITGFVLKMYTWILNGVFRKQMEDLFVPLIRKQLDEMNRID